MVAGTHRESDQCSCDVAVDSRLGHAYNEEAFRYLLGVQQKRSQRSDRSFLLLLVDLKDQPGLGGRIDPATARKLFSGLWRALREVDVIGWYREERIAGAVLTEFGNGAVADVSRLIVQRVTDTLAEAVSPSIARRLQVRVCQIQPRLKS
jgi:hypothetical protein